MIRNAIPPISAAAAISPSSSTVPVLELELVAEDSVEAVLAVVAVDDVSLPPSVSSLNALPLAALAALAAVAALAAGTRMPTANSAARAHRQRRTLAQRTE